MAVGAISILRSKDDSLGTASSAQKIVRDGLSSAQMLASSVDQGDQLRFAQIIIIKIVSAYWQELQARSVCHCPLRDPPFDIANASVSDDAKMLAETVGKAVAALDVMNASYMVGMLYTGMMPTKLRAELGAYYTPPALCERLLDMATRAGVDWQSARVLDPACGGGAFLSPVARRMVEIFKGCSAKIVLKNIQRQLHGFELDPFAAWISQVFLDITLDNLYCKAGMQLEPVVRVCDSLDQTPDGECFDLVVGNPPYGRVTLSPELRKKFSRSLFGHANLYGVFTDLALHFTRPKGVIAYVTPTSFLAGEYFKALRGLLGREAAPVNIDFIEERKGVFTGVLQEALLAVYRRGGNNGIGKVHFISPKQNGSIRKVGAGSFSLPESPEQPWLIPRTKTQNALLQQVNKLPYRLADYGYTVSTGPLVWNRHKSSLRDQPGKGRYPLVWAEAVRSDGTFEFRAQKRNHKPYFEPKTEEYWVVTDFPCVLLQRTTAKEQCRRLIAAELPESFIKEHGAVVIENHLNMIKTINGVPEISPVALAALLNSNVVDQVFRCINGSVAVSAYELEALPLPSPEGMKKIESLVRHRAKHKTLESQVKRLYVKEAR